MRMMMKVQMDTEAANKTLSDGSMPELLQTAMSQLRPEAAYFGPEDGVRTAFFIFDLADPSLIPAISEPLFQKLRAKITMIPVMNQDDLQRGLQSLGSS